MSESLDSEHAKRFTSWTQSRINILDD